MVKVLQDLKKNHHVGGIKAEFEAEGTRMEEAMRLKEVVMAAGLDLTIKVGGCEAIRDMYEARVLGVERIVAPMIETAFAMTKFVKAIDLVFPEDEKSHMDFAVNVETITGVKNFAEMLSAPGIERIGEVVIGRVDLTGSMGLGRDDINTDAIFDIANDICGKAKAKGIKTVIGGGVSAHSLPFFRKLPKGHLDRYETRKVIFSCPSALGDDAEKGILKAVYFELLWLKNKRDFYGLIFAEDANRITMLEDRYKKTMEKLGITK
jgi:hypothetical protein